jgi:hypothetical protein
MYGFRFFELDNSPVAVSDLPRHFGNTLCWGPADRTKQLTDQRRTLTDDLYKIAGNFSCQSKEHIGILTKFRCDPANCFFPWRWLLATFDFAQVGRFDSYAFCELAYGKSAILAGPNHSTLTQELSKRTSLNHV